MIDLKQVGVRDFDNAYIEFGITLWDSPYRASQYPAQFYVFIDKDRNGTDDYYVYNTELSGFGASGQNVVACCNFTTGRCSAYFYTDSGFNTQNWSTIPASAIGMIPGTAFNFQVLARDSWFTGNFTDCSPGDCATTIPIPWVCPSTPSITSSPTIPAQDAVNDRHQSAGRRYSLALSDRLVGHVSPG